MDIKESDILYDFTPKELIEAAKKVRLIEEETDNVITDTKEHILEALNRAVQGGKAISPIEASVVHSEEKRSTDNKVSFNGEFYTFSCPHCKGCIEVHRNEVNCHIFRHGYTYHLENGTIVLDSQINPHASKEECDRLISENKIIGCGKPFRLTRKEDNYMVEICEYI